ncbi:hypothetical protein [Streptomyces griseosporeus]
MKETELDKTRRYLRAVAPLDLPGVPAETHWSVYQWLPAFEAWATGISLCGQSMRQGPLPAGTTVSCMQCEEWRPRYERMLAPGYRPQDDDPELLRHRVQLAESQIESVRELVAQWGAAAVDRPDAVILVGVAADVLSAALNRAVGR